MGGEIGKIFRLKRKYWYKRNICFFGGKSVSNESDNLHLTSDWGSSTFFSYVNLLSRFLNFKGRCRQVKSAVVQTNSNDCKTILDEQINNWGSHHLVQRMIVIMIYFFSNLPLHTSSSDVVSYILPVSVARRA